MGLFPSVRSASLGWSSLWRLLFLEIKAGVVLLSVVIVLRGLLPAALWLCIGRKRVIVQEEIVVCAVQLEVEGGQAIFSGLNVCHAVLALLLGRPAARHLLPWSLTLLRLLLEVAPVIVVAVVVAYEVVLLRPAGALADSSADRRPLRVSSSSCAGL